MGCQILARRLGHPLHEGNLLRIFVAHSHKNGLRIRGNCVESIGRTRVGRCNLGALEEADLTLARGRDTPLLSGTPVLEARCSMGLTIDPIFATGAQIPETPVHGSRLCLL